MSESNALEAGATDDDEEEPIADIPEECPPTLPGWVTTFADLMSLLMCFFVMLVSMSTIELTTYKKMVQSVYNELGAGSLRATPTEQISTDGSTTQQEATQENPWSELRDQLKDEISAGKIEIEEDGDQVKIQLLQAITFGPGSSTLKRSFKSIAKRMRNVLSRTTGRITVVGHTDDRPIKSRRFRSNWELASARAVSVVAEMTKGTGLDANRFLVRSYGSTKPRVPNDTAENRAKNRRIALIVNRKEEGTEKKQVTKRKGSKERRFLLINNKNYNSISNEAMKQFLEKLQSTKPAPKTLPKKGQ